MPRSATRTAWTALALALTGVTSIRKIGRVTNASLASQENPPFNGAQCKELESVMKGQAWSWSSSIGASDTAIGTAQGSVCRTRQRMLDRANELMSASKMISGYTILKLVDEGLLTLDTRAAEVFDYWTATDGRKDVTLRHLMSLTAGLGKFPLGMGACTAGDVTGNGTRNCARQAYNSCFPSTFTKPGLEWDYTESTFYVMSAMALEVTGLSYWDEVFQKYLAGPLGVNGDDCRFSMPNMGMAFAGGGLRCTPLEYGKILQGILGKTVLKDASLYDEAERPQTLNVGRAPGHLADVQSCTEETKAQGCNEDMMPEWGVGRSFKFRTTPGVYWHYGLCQYIECATPGCEGGPLRVSSRGMMGTYPWFDRGVTGNPPHWGIVVRLRPITGQSIIDLEREVLPVVIKALQ